MGKKIWIFIVIGFIILGGLVFFLKGDFFKEFTGVNQNNPSPNQGMLYLCQQSPQKISLNSGNYVVFILGIANESCHWMYSDAIANQTKDCYYPLNYTSNSTFYLSGLLADNNSLQCSDNSCPQEIQMVQNYCV